MLVKARVNKRDDRVSLIANDLAVPELATGEAGLPIRVSLRTDQCTPERVAKLKEVLTHHPGTSEVHLTLVYGTKMTALRLDDSLKVMHTSALMGDLKALLGPGCLGG